VGAPAGLWNSCVSSVDATLAVSAGQRGDIIVRRNVAPTPRDSVAVRDGALNDETAP